MILMVALAIQKRKVSINFSKDKILLEFAVVVIVVNGNKSISLKLITKMSILLVSFVLVADLESLILFNLKKYLLRKIYVS